MIPFKIKECFSNDLCREAIEDVLLEWITWDLGKTIWFDNEVLGPFIHHFYGT